MLARWGARRWLPRLMIAWGVASVLTIFAVGPYSLYALRALVGVAEAGLMPGILFYLGYWFTKEYRARANGMYLAALPLALAIGGPLSGAIMELDGLLGLQGWRWLFILEGLPSIIVGFVALSLLPNTPGEVGWLTHAEKDALLKRLEQERATKKAPSGHSWREAINPKIVILAISYFCIMVTANSLGVWTPQIINELVGMGSRPLIIGLLTAVPPICAIGAMQLVTRHSDKTGERVFHLLGSMAAVVLGWSFVALVSAPSLKLVGLVFSFSGCYSAMAIFWTTIAHTLPRHAQAVGIAFISTIGTLASITSPTVIGFLRDLTHSFYAGIWYMAALMLIGMTIVAAVTKLIRGPMTAA